MLVRDPLTRSKEARNSFTKCQKDFLDVRVVAAPLHILSNLSLNLYNTRLYSIHKFSLSKEVWMRNFRVTKF